MNSSKIEIIDEFLKDFNLEFKDIKLEGNLEIIKKELYLMDDELYEKYKQFKSHNVLSAGLYLGSLEKRFKPSFNFLKIIEPQIKNKAIIKKEKEFLFICGRDLTPDSFENEVNEKTSLVVNKNGTVLGIVKKSKSSKKGFRIFFKNILDIGILLRREMTNKSRRR